MTLIGPELDEVTDVVQALARFSSETSHEIALELDGEQVGWIEHGTPTRSLQEGLLDEWAAELRRREAAGTGGARWPAVPSTAPAS